MNAFEQIQNDPNLGQTGTDKEIRDLAAATVVNPYELLKRYVSDSTSAGRRVLARLNELAQQK